MNIRACCCSRKHERIRKILLLFVCLNREELGYAENQKQQRSVHKGRLERREEKIKVAKNYEFHALDRANVRLSLSAFLRPLNNQERTRTRRRSMKTIICLNKNNHSYK